MDGDPPFRQLDAELTEPLVNRLTDPSAVVRTAALRALVRLPLASGARERVWSFVAGGLQGMGDSPAIAPTDLLQAAAYVPLPQVRVELERRARTGPMELRLEAVTALARARDKRAVSPLLELLKDPSEGTRARAAEWLWLFDLPNEVSTLSRCATRDPDVIVRFWCAMAAARSGSPGALVRLLQEIGRKKVEFPLLWGDPQVLMGRLQGYPPPTGELHRALARLVDDPEIDSSLQGFARDLLDLALTPGDTTAAPPTARIAPGNAAPSASEQAAAARAAQECLRRIPDEPFGSAGRETIAALFALAPADATRLVSRLVQVAIDRRGQPENHGLTLTLEGNEIAGLVAALRAPFVPDIPSLFAGYRRLPDSDMGLPAQIAWMAGRAGLDHLLRGLAPLLTDDDEQVRVAAARLVEHALRRSTQQGPPIFGGGEESADVEPPAELAGVTGTEPLPQRAPRPPAPAAAGAGSGPGSWLGGLLERAVSFGRRGRGGAARSGATPPGHAPPPPTEPPPGHGAAPQPAPDASAREPVRLGASFPPGVRPGGTFVARVVAYVPAQEKAVGEMLSKLSRRELPQLGLRDCRWALGTRVVVVVSGDHLSVAPAQQEFTWEGGHNLLDFEVRVAADAPLGFVALRIDVAVEGFPLVIMRPELEITDRPQENARTTVQGKPAERAFASYASEDRLRVLDRVSAAQISAGLDVFLDCLSLHPGEEWKPRLKEEIHDRDLFLLFWSRAARASKWVTWEWETALQTRGVESIQLHPLEAPEEAPPPEELRHLHFNDAFLLAREAYERRVAGKG